MRGIKTAAAIWITGAVGFAIGVDLWWLGAIVGLATAVILFVADLAPVVSPRATSEDDAGGGVSGRRDD